MMCELAMVSAKNLKALPRIEDDHSEHQVGYSFLCDLRNDWVAKGKDLVLNQILELKKRQKEW
jgi:hypothetical protein